MVRNASRLDSKPRLSRSPTRYFDLSAQSLTVTPSSPAALGADAGGGAGAAGAAGVGAAPAADAFVSTKKPVSFCSGPPPRVAGPIRSTVVVTAYHPSAASRGTSTRYSLRTLPPG